MRTKLEAAEIAMNCGGAAVIANGDIPDILGRIFCGRKRRHSFLALRTNARKASLDRVRGGRSRARGGGRRGAPRTHAKKSKPAGVGRGARRWPVCVDGRGQHRGWRRSGIRARHRELRQPASGRTLRRKTSQAAGGGQPGSLVLFTRDNIVLMQK